MEEKLSKAIHGIYQHSKMNESALVTTFEMLIERLGRVEDRMASMESYLETNERSKLLIEKGTIVLHKLPNVPIVKSPMSDLGVVVQICLKDWLFEHLWEKNKDFQDYVIQTCPSEWMEDLKSGNVWLLTKVKADKYFDDPLNYLSLADYFPTKFIQNLVPNLSISYSDSEGILIVTKGVSDVYDLLTKDLKNLFTRIDLTTLGISRIYVYDECFQINEIALRCVLDTCNEEQNRLNSSLRSYLRTLDNSLKQETFTIIETLLTADTIHIRNLFDLIGIEKLKQIQLLCI